ncbi:hypothetical protein GJ496_001607 [Pomphorhynchus laevis]|nr:hypothetical protein GJ496_001607 [Pomphorhynchus laevis]
MTVSNIYCRRKRSFLKNKHTGTQIMQYEIEASANMGCCTTQRKRKKSILDSYSFPAQSPDISLEEESFTVDQNHVLPISELSTSEVSLHSENELQQPEEAFQIANYEVRRSSMVIQLNRIINNRMLSSNTMLQSHEVVTAVLDNLDNYIKNNRMQPYLHDQSKLTKHELKYLKDDLESRRIFPIKACVSSSFITNACIICHGNVELETSKLPKL